MPLEKNESGQIVTYDVVVANILFVVLSKIIGDLAKVTKSKGTVILSGLLDEQCSEMLSLSNEHGLVLSEKTSKEE